MYRHLYLVALMGLMLPARGKSQPVEEWVDPVDIQYVQVKGAEGNRILFQEVTDPVVQWAENVPASDLRSHWFLEATAVPDAYVIRNRVTGDGIHIQSASGFAEVGESQAGTGSHRWTFPSQGSGFRIQNQGDPTAALSTAGSPDPDLRTEAPDTTNPSQVFVIEPLPIGAAVPWVSYDEENIQSLEGGAEIQSTTWDQNSMLIEAQKRSALYLGPVNSSVRWTATVAADVLTLRYAVADGQSGVITLNVITASGTVTQAVPVTSHQAWIYFENGHEYDTPRPGRLPAKRYNEARVHLDSPLSPGDTLELVRHAGTPAIWVDVLETETAELVSPTDPASFLDITQPPYSAAGNGTSDDTNALEACLADAIAQGKSVHLPPGRYRLTREIQLASGAVLEGAGMWHTELVFTESGAQGDGGLNADGDGVQVRDLYLVGAQTVRDGGYKALKGRWGPGSAIVNVWTDHTETGAWLDDFAAPIEATDGLRIFNCRFRNAFADGVNFAGGSRNGVVDNCHFRGNGDDAIATWASGVNRGLPMAENMRFRYNTVECTFRAAGIAIHGGSGHVVQRNLVRDQSVGAGIRFTSIFEFSGSTRIGYGFGTTTDMHIYRNRMERTGNVSLFGEEIGAIDLNLQHSNITRLLFEDNVVVDSRYAGIRFSGLSAPGRQQFADITVRSLEISGAPVGTRVSGQAAGTVAYSRVNLLTPGLEFEYLTSDLTIEQVGAGVQVFESGGGTAVAEGGAGDSYTLGLSTPPTRQVTVTLVPDAQLQVAPASVTFTPADWEQTKTITLSAIDDADIEGFHTGQITHAVSSTDPAYDGVTVTSVQAFITDNDVNNPPILSLDTPTYVALAFGNGLILEGTLSDDGPSLTSSWAQIEGPDGGTALFDDASALNTGVTFSQSGDYLLRFTADDGEYTVTGDVIVYVDSSFPGAYFGGVDIGLVDAGGSAAASTGNYTVRGSGADIWLEFDEFFFFHSPFSGDGHITIRLTQQQNTHPWAKVGVMMRDTLTAGSTHALLAVTPENGVVLQSRPTTRGLSENEEVISAASTALPVWLRLTRKNGIVTAATSSDGISFTPAGTAVAPMSGENYLGVAITSHNDGIIGEASFDNLATSLGNRAPEVTAGPDASFWLGFPLVIEGMATDDGIPSSPGTLFPTWTLKDGPGSLELTSPDQWMTEITGEDAGSYSLRLSVDDGELTAFAERVLTGQPLELPAATSWQSHHFTSAGAESVPTADPNQDGVPNWAHFALDTSPGSSGPSSPPLVPGIMETGGSEYFSITLPARRGAVFQGSPVEASVDGLIYRLTATDDLTGGELDLVEVTSVPSGMPPLGDYDGNGQPDYEYRTFRITSPLGRLAFIRLDILPDTP